MSVSLDVKRLFVKDTTKKTFIPDSNISRLMYYIDCVCCVIQYNKDSKFWDYQNYHYLTSEERQTVLDLAYFLVQKYW